MPVLYRKYRPQKFDEKFIGQNLVKRILTNSVLFDRVGHAYLFCGLKGSGKTTSARIYAKAVNCLENMKNKGNPCDECENCKMIQAQEAMDIIEIDAASNRGIDEIREIREQVKVSPSRLKYKVYIIDEAHMLTKDAFNALLKTLEEPPAHAMFILVTTEPERIPNTILSRVQRLDFKPLNPKELTGAIKSLAKEEGFEIDDGSIESIVSSAGGSVRDVWSNLEKMRVLQGEKIMREETNKSLGIADTKDIIKFTEILISGSLMEAIKFIDGLQKEGYKIDLFLDSFINYLRVLTLYKVDKKQAVEIVEDNYAVDFVSSAEGMSSKIDGRTLVEWLQKFIEFKRVLKSSNNEDYAFDIILMKIWGKKEGGDLFATGDFGSKSVRDNVDNKQIQAVQGCRKISYSDVKEEMREENVVRDENKVASPKSQVSNEKVVGEESKVQNSIMKNEETIDVKKEDNEKQEAEKIEESEPVAEDDIELSDLEKVWPRLVEDIKGYNHGVSSFLKTCKPIEIVKGNTVIVGCQSDFHKNLLSESKNQEKTSEIAAELLKNKIIFEFVVAD